MKLSKYCTVTFSQTYTAVKASRYGLTRKLDTYALLYTSSGGEQFIQAHCQTNCNLVVRVWNSHLKVEYSNHSVAPVGQIFGSRGPLECLVPSNERCCGDGTGGHWYHPDGTPVSGDRSRFIRSTRGGLGEEEAAVYLHWRFYHGYDKQLGLFRCEIPASGANSDIQVVYVGLYRGDRPNQGT